MISLDEIKRAWSSDSEDCAFDSVIKFYPNSSVFANSSSEESVVFMSGPRESFSGIAHFWREACILANEGHLTFEELEKFSCVSDCKKLSPRNFISSIQQYGEKGFARLELPDPDQIESCYQMKADWNLQVFIAQCKAKYYYYSWETTA